MPEHPLMLVKYMLESEGWQVIQKYLNDQLNADIFQLSSPNRESPQTDDFLRGRISVFRYFLQGIPAQIEELEFETQKRAKRQGQPQGVGSPYESQDNPEETE